MSKDRFHEIDLLRGVACVMVVAFHYLHRGQRDDWITSQASPWVEGIARYGYLGVHLFFIISGFVIFMSAQNATTRGFVASRVARLYPAFWFAAPLTALVAWFVGSEIFKVSPTQLLVNLTMAPHWFGVEFVDGAYWSLAVELHFYLLVALALATGSLSRAEWLVGLWLALSLLNTLRPIYPLEFWLDVKWAPLFCGGICAYLIRDRGATKARIALFALAYLLALDYAVAPLLLAPPPPLGTDTDNPWVVGVAITLFYALFVGIAFRRFSMRPNPVAIWAGLLTYPVYLLHQNIGYILLGLLPGDVLPFSVRILMVSAVIGATAWCCVRFIEQPFAPRLRRALDPARARSRALPQAR